jgi:outer membrane protein TolC
MDNRGRLPNELLGMVAVNVPVWRDRYRAAERGAASELRRAQREYAALRNELQAEAEMALFEMREAGRTLRLLETHLLPKAQQRLRLIEAGYRTGDVAFPDLIEAQRALLETELGHARARSEHLRRQAAWERLTGRPNAGTVAGLQETSPAGQP